MALKDQYSAVRFAQLCADAIAKNDAALSADFDEACFRARMITDWAVDVGLSTIAETALEIERLLDRPSAEPGAGYGDVMLRLSELFTPSR